VIEDEQLLSEDSSDEESVAEEEEAEEDPLARETADEKRIRLAKEYLSRVEVEVGSDDESGEEDGVVARLRQDALRMAGKSYAEIAAKLQPAEAGPTFKGHRTSVTCVALTSDEATAFSGSKDSSVIRWDLETGKALHKFAGDKKGKAGHKGHVLALAVSSDDKLLATGGMDKQIRIWDLRTNSEITPCLRGHRDAIQCLSFQLGTHTLYSGSSDRTVKGWAVDEMGYKETVYGHASSVHGIDCLRRERPVSVGHDSTLRIWKIAEATQLILRGHTASIDACCQLDEQQSFSGSQDGSLCLWSSLKKKPAHTYTGAHGGGWICSVAAARYTDLVASGSTDGVVRLWQVAKGKLHQVQQVEVPGAVNGLAFGHNNGVLVAGVGQDHRLGRWDTYSEGKNGLRVIKLSYEE